MSAGRGGPAYRLWLGWHDLIRSLQRNKNLANLSKQISGGLNPKYEVEDVLCRFRLMDLTLDIVKEMKLPGKKSQNEKLRGIKLTCSEETYQEFKEEAERTGFTTKDLILLGLMAVDKKFREKES